MDCVERLILKFDMLEVGSGVDARLGDDVGAGRRLAKRQMRLDDRALRVGATSIQFRMCAAWPASFAVEMKTR